MRSVDTVLRFGLLACFALAMAADAQATIYYVNPSGDDANTGTSAAPFRTIKQAAKVIVGGDTVYVAAGTYTDDIVLNGVQGSSLPAVFVGSSGATVNAQWKVVNSNYVQIEGFTFQGTTSRFLVWQGSYEGRIENCHFSAGDEGLLIKSGSLTIDNCLIENFTYDGIQVDGEADVLVQGSTISGCQDAGMEIRKVARVEFNNCTVSGQVGDGIEVNITADSIDGGFTAQDLMSGPIPLAVSNGPVTFGGQNYIYGDFYYTPGETIDDSKVSGTVAELPSGSPMTPIDPGDAATNNNNANIPLTDKGNNPLDANLDFTMNTDGLDLPPGTYYFNSLLCSGQSTIRLSGPTIIYVVGDVFLKGVANSTLDPENLQLYVMGDNVIVESDTVVHAVIYAPSAHLDLTGSDIYGMVVGESWLMGGQAKIHTDESLTELALSLINIPPTTPLPVGWTPVSSGELDINGGTMLSNNANAVRMVTPQVFTATSSDFTSNGWGLRLKGSFDLTNCTVSNNTTGGVWLTGLTDADVQVVNLTLANNAQYGVYAESCNLTFNSTNIADWTISGSQTAIAGVGSGLAFGAVTISGGTTAGVQLSQGTMDATGTTFSGNGYGLAVYDSNVTLTSCILSGNTTGLHADQNTFLQVNGSNFTGNTQWGASVTPKTAGGLSVIFDACTLHSNAGGLALVNAVDGEVSLQNGTLIRDNTNSGLHFENCNLTVNDQAGGTAWRTLRNGYGISSTTSTLTLSSVSIEESSLYGVYCEDSSVSLANCTVTGVGGVYADAANNSLTVASTRFDASSAGGWGVARYGGNVEVKNCVINGFDGGVYLSTASSGDQAAVNNSTLVNLAADGVYLADGDATVQNTVLVGGSSAYGLTQVSGQLTHSYNLLNGFGTPYSGTTIAAGELLANPRFVDAANGDFRLAKGSPAINSGADLTASGVTIDMLGNARPSRKVFEIGAYEYVQDGGSLRVLNWKEDR